MSIDQKPRCFGNKKGQEFYALYHDNEWGIEVHDEQKLFENLILEGAQAGLSWETILKRRDGYREVFYQFDINKCATLSDEELERCLKDERIIRNRLKVFSVRKNAIAFQKIQREYGSFDAYIWGFVDRKPIHNQPKDHNDLTASSPLSDQISKDLKKRGMSFVGSKIIYAYLQAIGIVIDHLQTCWKYQHTSQGVQDNN